MTSFQVVPAELSGASTLIRSAGDVLSAAESAAVSAQAMGGAFGGEPIEAAFDAACGRAVAALGALVTTIGTLANCVQAAGEGYLITDHGIIAAAGVPGAVAGSHASGAGAGAAAGAGAGVHTLSPTWGRP
jgi:hypothetical protein